MKGFVYKISQASIHNQKLAVARTVLALGSLITLLFTNIDLLTHTDYLYDTRQFDAYAHKVGFLQYSAFQLFPAATGKIICIIVLLLVMSGYLPQVVCVLHAWVNISITNSFVPVDGGDQIAANLSVLLIPLCITDNRMNQWSPARPHNPYINVFAVVCLFMIQLQAAVIYLQSGMGKITAVDWREGVAAYYWLSHPIHGATGWLRSLYETVTLTNMVYVLTWLIMLFEVFLFACIFANKNVKAVFFVLAIGFHLMIVVTHGLLSFFFSMLALLILYLDDANYSVKLVNRIKAFAPTWKRRITMPSLIFGRS